MPGSNYAYSTGEFFDSPEITNQSPMTYQQPNQKFTIPGYLQQSTPKLNITFPKLNFSQFSMRQSTDNMPAAYETKTFDRNAKLKEMYGTQASKRDRRRFNKYWNSDQRYADQNAFEAQEHQNYMDNLDARWKAIGDKVGQQTATSVAEIQNSLNSRQPIQQTPQQSVEQPKNSFNTNYWLSEAQRVNPNFKSIDDVIAWQKENGLAADGKFGKASRAKWDSLQAPAGTSTKIINGQEYSVAPDFEEMPGNNNYDQKQETAPKQNTQSSQGSGFGDKYSFDFNTPFHYWGDGIIPAVTKSIGHNVATHANNATRLFKDSTNFLGSLFFGSKPFNKQGGIINKHQQGGTMQNEQELQKAFMAYLIEDAAAQGMQIQSEKDLQAYAQQLGEEGLKAKYQEFMQKMQGGVKAALGTKLNYIHKLKGNCPEGEELVYMKQGGRVCPVCQKKAEKAKSGDKLQKKNAISDFKEKRKQHVNPNDTVHVGGKPKSLTNSDGSRVDKRFPAYTAKDYQNDKKTKDGQKRRMKADLVSSEKCGGKTKKK